MVERFRIGEEDRRTVIVTAINRLARDLGDDWRLRITHSAVSDRCSVQTSVATVRHYFPTKADLIANVTES